MCRVARRQKRNAGVPPLRGLCSRDQNRPMGCATLRIEGAQAADAACGVRGEVSHCMESASYMDRIMYS